MKLKPGDIIFEVIEEVDDIYHCWIYGGAEGEDSQRPMIHSSVSQTSRIQGVTRHELTKLGDRVIVFRCQDLKLTSNILAVAKNFAPLLSKEQIQAISELGISSTSDNKVNIYAKTGVPFTPISFNRRIRDSLPSLQMELNIFRIVRAALRSGVTSGKSKSLSKIRGVSCNQFVNYCVHAGALLSILGKEEVEKLRSLAEPIDSKGIKAYLATKDLSHLQKLVDTVNKLTAQAEKNLLMTDLEINKIFSFPTKGTQIYELVEFLKGSTLFKMINADLELKKDSNGYLHPYLIELKATEPSKSDKSELSGKESCAEPASAPPAKNQLEKQIQEAPPISATPLITTSTQPRFFSKSQDDLIVKPKKVERRSSWPGIGGRSA